VLKIKINIWIYSALALVMIVFYYLEVWSSIRESLFSIIPYYNKYADRPEYLLSEEASSGIGVLFFITLSIVTLLYYKLIDNTVIVNSVYIGLIVFLFASGNLNIYRVSNYFSFSIIISIGLLLKNSSKNFSRIVLIFISIIWMQGLIYSNQAGCKPYNHIFSKEANENKLLQDEDVVLK
jgi:hypothetical protein